MKRSNFALRLQPSLLEAARKIAAAEGVALNQLINVAVGQMIASHATADYLATRAKRGNVARALEILNRPRKGEPPREGDELPESWKARASHKSHDADVEGALALLRRPRVGEPPRKGDELPKSWQKPANGKGRARLTRSK